MYPKLFGIVDSYTVLLILGVISAFVVLVLFLKNKQYKRNEIIDILICSVIAVVFGIVFAILFQNIYDLVNYQSSYRWTWGMTFFGGVFGGVFAFIFAYNIYYKKNHESAIKDILLIAPGCLSLAHFFGRIGCFLDGCCYGKETSSPIGVIIPVLNDNIKRIPTQLIEAIFLLIISSILLVLAFKNLFKHTLVIYTGAYSIFRFVIEFYRGDYRGKFILGFSPSQIWCFILLVMTPGMFILLNQYIFKGGKKDEKFNS